MMKTNKTPRENNEQISRLKHKNKGPDEVDKKEFEYALYEVSKSMEISESLRKRVEQILAFWIGATPIILGITAAITTSQNVRYTTITVVLGIASLCIGGIGLVALLGATATRAKESIESLRVDSLRCFISSRFPFAKNINKLLGPFNRCPGKFSPEFSLFIWFLLFLNSILIPLGIMLSFNRIANVIFPTVFPGTVWPDAPGIILSGITLIVIVYLQITHYLFHKRLIQKEKMKLDFVLTTLDNSEHKKNG